MFDRPEEFFESHPIVLEVAVKMKPGRRRIPGVWHHLMHRLASLRGIGAGTPWGVGMDGADMGVTVYYSEPEVKRVLFAALDSDEDVESYTIVEPKACLGQSKID
jgi:hypothetical protein